MKYFKTEEDIKQIQSVQYSLLNVKTIFFKHFFNYLSLGFSIKLLHFSSEAQGPYNLALFNH